MLCGSLCCPKVTVPRNLMVPLRIYPKVKEYKLRCLGQIKPSLLASSRKSFHSSSIKRFHTEIKWILANGKFSFILFWDKFNEFSCSLMVPFFRLSLPLCLWGYAFVRWTEWITQSNSPPDNDLGLFWRISTGVLYDGQFMFNLKTHLYINISRANTM